MIISTLIIEQDFIKKDNNIENMEISELCTFSLGGYAQKVLIEGKYRSNPVVITLHGGPGTPIPFSVGCRGMFPEFTDEFVMVYWDQLGCGINNAEIDDSFSIDMFVTMTVDLITQIKLKFPNNKVLIFATSWGTILSAKLVEKHPYAVDGIIACGQIVKNVFICDEVRNTLEQSNIPTKKAKKINNITKENFTGKDLQLISSSLRKYTNAYQNKNSKKAPLGKIVKGLLTSPDYKMKDFKAIMINGYMKNTSLWKEIIAIDLSQQLKNARVPYEILQGDTDIVASTKRVEQLVSVSENNNLKYRVITNTGHMPGVEMMDTLVTVLREYS